MAAKRESCAPPCRRRRRPGARQWPAGRGRTPPRQRVRLELGGGRGSTHASPSVPSPRQPLRLRVMSGLCALTLPRSRRHGCALTACRVRTFPPTPWLSLLDGTRDRLRPGRRDSGVRSTAAARRAPGCWLGLADARCAPSGARWKPGLRRHQWLHPSLGTPGASRPGRCRGAGGDHQCLLGALLPAAYEQGAGLLKFGGDALLLFLEGEGHARRACAAAHEMRRRLGEFTRSKSVSGAGDLRISIGVHSDRFHFFLVGGSHRELLVAGSGATQTVACESAAEGGDILVSRATAAAVEPEAVGLVKGPGVLLRAAPAIDRPIGTPEPLSLPGPILGALVPAGLREYIEDGVLEPEHRDATVAFIRFAGVEQMLAAEGTDAVADALEQLVRATQNAVEEEGINFLDSDIATDGGKLYVVAGAA